MMQALLSNIKDKDVLPVKVTFPLSDYKEVYAKLEAIGIGNAMERDCYVNEICKGYQSLKLLEMISVNVDELDYLIKRLESFDKRELAKFQGIVFGRGYFDMTDLINLTFCCQEATVVRDFTDLNAIGREHYMDLHGGIAKEDLKTIDFRDIARALLSRDSGKITPYGVIYENDMCMKQLYNGQHLLDYQYNCDAIMTIAITDRHKPEESASATYLDLPMEDCQIERTMMRSGIGTFDDMRMRYHYNELSIELTDLLSEGENLHDLNCLCTGFQILDDDDRQKLEAVIEMARPTTVKEAANLIAQLDLFDFTPDVRTLEDYGRYMIADSGHYEYDSELDRYYDFKKYGEERSSQEYGMFVPAGYVSYHGFVSIEEVMAGSETERIDMKMGGM